MNKRFYFTLLVVAVILVALPGLTGSGIRRVTRHPRRFARRLLVSIRDARAGWAPSTKYAEPKGEICAVRNR
jgi:hypothetical protein